MKNGATVAAFECEFAAYVGARYAIALCNGTATLHTALVALGVKPGDRVAVPPLTMSATTIAVLHAGGVPVFRDVEPDTWLMRGSPEGVGIGVSLYGLHFPVGGPHGLIDDAAQTLREHSGAAFTSYSFQASKIFALGEGGMLATDDEELAVRARSFSSLGYEMEATQPRIDPNTLKHPDFARHHSLGWNYRMNDLTAAEGLKQLDRANELVWQRRNCASFYQIAIKDCDWLTPQHVPDGWTHDYWTFAVATDTPERCLKLLDAVEKHGGERPYPAWRLTYNEPAFAHLNIRERCVRCEERSGGGRGQYACSNCRIRRPSCPVAESLQSRLVQFQTNDLDSAIRNARALRRAIEELP